MKTLQSILVDANSYLDLEAEVPSGSEYTLRANYANQAVWDASATTQLAEFDVLFEQGTENNSAITLPENFREFKHNPMILDSTGSWIEYEEILPKDKYSRSSQDRYCYVLGNPQSRYVAYFNNIIASATVSILLQRYPSGMATLTDKCELSDPTYVTATIESYVLQSRGDDRFPYVDTTRNTKLKNMIGREMKGPGGQGRITQTTFKSPLT